MGQIVLLLPLNILICWTFLETNFRHHQMEHYLNVWDETWRLALILTWIRVFIWMKGMERFLWHHHCWPWYSDVVSDYSFSTGIKWIWIPFMFPDKTTHFKKTNSTDATEFSLISRKIPSSPHGLSAASIKMIVFVSGSSCCLCH